MPACKYCDKQTITPEMVICIDHYNIIVERLTKPKIIKIIHCQRKNCLTVLETPGFCDRHKKEKRMK